MADGKRYRTPDVVALRKPGHGRPADPANVLLVVELTSPGGGDEWSLKMQAYAEAGIPGYLIIGCKPSGYTATHHVLVDGGYKQVAYVSEDADDTVLKVTEPFAFSLDLKNFRPRHEDEDE